MGSGCPQLFNVSLTLQPRRARPANHTQTDNVFLEDFLAIKRNREKYYVFNSQFLLALVALVNLPYY